MVPRYSRKWDHFPHGGLVWFTGRLRRRVRESGRRTQLGDARFAAGELSGDFARRQLACIQHACSQPGDIFVAAPDGSGMRQLTDDAHRDRAARWSPDGSRIAFYSDRSGKYEVWTINRDGSGLRQITSTPRAPSLYPVWAPDGNQLAYLVRTDTVHVVDLQRPITGPPRSLVAALDGRRPRRSSRGRGRRTAVTWLAKSSIVAGSRTVSPSTRSRRTPMRN